DSTVGRAACGESPVDCSSHFTQRPRFLQPAMALPWPKLGRVGGSMRRSARQSMGSYDGPDPRAMARRRSLAAAVLAVVLGAALLFDLPSHLTPAPTPD